MRLTESKGHDTNVDNDHRFTDSDDGELVIDTFTADGISGHLDLVPTFSQVAVSVTEVKGS